MWIITSIENSFQNKNISEKNRKRKAAAIFCIWLSQGGWFDTFVQMILQFNTMGVKFILDPHTFSLSYKSISGGKRRYGTQKRRR